MRWSPLLWTQHCKHLSDHNDISKTRQVLGLLPRHWCQNFSMFYQSRSQSRLKIMQHAFFIQLADYIIRCFSISQQYLCVWVPENDILRPSLPTAAAYSFLPLKDQSWENGSVFSPQGSLFWQSSAIPRAQLPKTIKIVISLKQLLGWGLITRLFLFSTCYFKSSLI